MTDFIALTPDEEDAQARLAQEGGVTEANVRIAELQRLSLAYARVFNKDSEDVKIVLNDLARFGRLFTTSVDVDANGGMVDPRTHMLIEGRREVACRVIDFARLDYFALYAKYYSNRT